MAGENVTSTGHDLSAARWLDTHYESARPEYEAALRDVGVKSGDAVLDAGSGSGGFLPVLCELVGQGGSVAALDLAPENVARIEANIQAGVLPPNVQPKVGDVLAPPFPDGVFDRVWCANVAQYLTASEFARMIMEFRRVAKPGGSITIKEFDSSLMQLHPLANECLARLWTERRRRAASDLIGPWGGTSILRSCGPRASRTFPPRAGSSNVGLPRQPRCGVFSKASCRAGRGWRRSTMHSLATSQSGTKS